MTARSADEVTAACGLPAVEGRFRPHVGIAYCNRDVPAEPIIRRVAGLRDLPSVEVPGADLRLVPLYRDGPTYSGTRSPSCPYTPDTPNCRPSSRAWARLSGIAGDRCLGRLPPQGQQHAAVRSVGPRCAGTRGWGLGAGEPEVLAEGVGCQAAV
jgi:hypothetical protein